MLRTLVDPSRKHGAFHLGESADDVPGEKLFLNEADEKIVYDHFIETVSKY